MPLESMFSLATMLAVAGWVLLVFVPRLAWAQLVAGVILPATLSAMYLVLVALHFPGASGGFGSLAEVTLLFSQPPLLLAGWIHYLAFDLFIGGWETRDAARTGVPHLLVVPCLFLTFMLGPIGLLVYLAVRTWRTQTMALTTA